MIPPLGMVQVDAIETAAGYQLEVAVHGAKGDAAKSALHTACWSFQSPVHILCFGKA